MADFSTILVANRGEIALRVIESAKALGYRAVAVYSDADAEAPHVLAADEAVHLGPAPVTRSYLDVDKVLAACRKTGADAVHPGYGFLSENADFAEACEQAGIVFIGPPSDAIRLMGSKRESKLAMMDADVPCIPGYEGDSQETADLVEQAGRIGFPLMIKASAGGGGRGMRQVDRADELEAHLKSARSEAKSAFGNGELILEKAVQEPRHVEIQVFADTHGNAIYLGERDCSIQRRHQKVVEEAPCPVMDPELRRRMGEAAVDAARACDYVGAGTVEFMLDHDRHFYFLEMNTRLQVEHPVTELITGTDLVAWQIKVAAGGELPLTQEQVELEGHAIEVRLYAEDPARQFMPQTGPIRRWRPAAGPGIRIDEGIAEGGEVSPYYDPMLAKMIAYGDTRDDARRRLARAVENTLFLGVNSNKRFLANILEHPVFADGEATTSFIGRHFTEDPSMRPAEPNPRNQALAALIFYIHSALASTPSRPLANWRSSGGNRPWPVKLGAGDTQHEVRILPETPGIRGSHYRISVDAGAEPAGEFAFELVDFSDETLVYNEDGVRRRIHYVLDGDALYLATGQGNESFRDRTHAPPAKPDPAANGRILAPMDGAVVEIGVGEGDRVARNQTVGALEAMKMEHQLITQVDGEVASVQAAAGDQVKSRQLLIEITPDDASE